MILAVLQARMSSSRLPGKVLKPILGVPMLKLQIERIRRSQLIDCLVVATSTDVTDDSIEELCKEIECICFRGNLEDVLDRYYRASLAHFPKHVVRLTGDCPLVDSSLIDRLISFHIEGGFDYSSNCLEPTFPDGLDAEIMTFDTLCQAWRQAASSVEREHVTLYINSRPAEFKLGSYKQNENMSHLRWTVDEDRDFELVERIYRHLYPNYKNFTTSQILEFLDRDKQLADLNKGIVRNEGLARSLAKEVKRRP